MATHNCFFHWMIFLFYSSLLLILLSYFPDKSMALESHFGTVEISSLLTAPECSRQLTDPNGRPQSTLEVFHIHGPCSPTDSINMPSAQDILCQDRSRVLSLHKPNKYHSQFQATTEAANLPVQFSPGNYAITLSLGTPAQELVFIFDTSKNLTWTRCFSNPYRLPVNFNPDASTSFSSIPCINSSICTSQLLPNHTCNQFKNTDNTCFYNIKYSVGSYSIGAFSMDSLTITQTGDVFPNFLFGCARKISLGFDAVAGILGLGRNTLSFVEQTEQTYWGVFSYCFPSTASSTGFLKLGPRDYPNDVIFTPLSTNSDHPSFYFIDITSIRVGNVSLSIDPFDLKHPGTIIDSGTVITRLSMNVYSTMRDEFRKQMNGYGYQIVPDADDLLDTCYNTSSYSNITIPTISFTFNGNVTVGLDASTTLYVFDSTLACLAFAGNSNGDDLAIFGNTQQKRFEVVYDVEGEKLGFIPGGCK